MTGERAARSVLDSLPGWSGREALITPLEGGLNNRSYIVDSRGERLVLRIANGQDPSAVRNHETELTVQQSAASNDLAAKVVHADPARGVLLSNFIPGRVLRDADIHDRDNLATVAALLRRLHRLPRCGVTFDVPGIAERYYTAIRQDEPHVEFAAYCRQVVLETPSGGDLCCCHNDVVAGNLVLGTSAKLLDFEYARDNDPCYDLASVIGWHNLPEDESRYFLECYAGSAADKWREQLGRQTRLFDAMQWLWMAAERSDRPVPGQALHMQRVEKRLRGH